MVWASRGRHAPSKRSLEQRQALTLGRAHYRARTIQAQPGKRPICRQTLLDGHSGVSLRPLPRDFVRAPQRYGSTLQGSRVNGPERYTSSGHADRLLGTRKIIKCTASAYEQSLWSLSVSD